MSWFSRVRPDRLHLSSASGGQLRREIGAGRLGSWLERALAAAGEGDRIAWQRGSPLSERVLRQVWPAVLPAPAHLLLARGRDGALWLEAGFDGEPDLSALAGDLLAAVASAAQPALAEAEPVIEPKPAPRVEPRAQPRRSEAAARAPVLPVPASPRSRPTQGHVAEPVTREDVFWLNPGDPLVSPRRGLWRVASIPRPGGPVLLHDAAGRPCSLTPEELCAEFHHALEA